MIYIVDRFVERHSHVLANVNMIRIISKVFPSYQKLFIAEKEHAELVLDYLSKENYTNIKATGFISYYFSQSRLGQICRVLTRIFLDFCFFLKLFRSVSKEKDSFIFILHLYPASLLFTKILKMFFRQVKVIMIVHGEVEYILYGKGLYQKIIGWLYKISFNLGDYNFAYIFLTKVSKDVIISERLLDKDKVLSIELPTFTLDEKSPNIRVAPQPLQIGHIGSAGLRKNVDMLYKLGEDFTDLIKESRLKLWIIGPIEQNLMPFRNEMVFDLVSENISNHLDRVVFNDKLRDMDYAIFFFGENDFILRSSGAFFDAIGFYKPIVALRNAFFENIFNDVGPIGYLCEDLEDMKKCIYKLVNNSTVRQEDYLLFVDNITKYRSKLTVNNIAQDLNAQLKAINFLKH